MKAFLLFLTILMLSLSTTYADDPDDDDAEFDDTELDYFEAKQANLVNLYNNSIGLSYSNVTGYGLNYSRRFLKDYSIGIAGILHYKEKMEWETMSKDVINLDEKDILYNFGIEIQRDIFTTNKTRMYVFLGGYLSTEESKNFSKQSGNAGGEDNKYNKVVGLGFGLQYYLSKHFAFNFHFAYKYDQLDYEEIGSPGLDISTGVGYGIGASVLL